MNHTNDLASFQHIIEQSTHLRDLVNQAQHASVIKVAVARQKQARR